MQYVRGSMQRMVDWSTVTDAENHWKFHIAAELIDFCHRNSAPSSESWVIVGESLQARIFNRHYIMEIAHSHHWQTALALSSDLARTTQPRRPSCHWLLCICILFVCVLYIIWYAHIIIIHASLHFYSQLTDFVSVYSITVHRFVVHVEMGQINTNL